MHSSHVIICLGRVVPASTKIEKLAMISEGGFELEYRQHFSRLFFPSFPYRDHRTSPFHLQPYRRQRTGYISFYPTDLSHFQQF